MAHRDAAAYAHVMSWATVGWAKVPVALRATMWTNEAFAGRSSIEGQLRFITEALPLQPSSELAEAIARYLLLPPTQDAPRQQAIRVAVELQALNSAAVWRVDYALADTVFPLELKDFGAVDVVFECEQCGLYRERVAPGATIPWHTHYIMEERELVLADGMLLRGEPCRGGVAHVWPRGVAHEYRNPTTQELSFLCVDAPKFIPSDEVVLEREFDRNTPVETIEYW